MARKTSKPSPIGTIHTTKYGTREIVGFDVVAGRRLDIFRPHEVHPKEPWNAEVRERPMCLDSRDATPVVSTYAAQLGETGPHVRAYNSDCSCCYLNISHTTAKHDAAIGVRS